ncbi:non-ribosomal peptide synthetase [Haliangium ochraceum]|uniref:Amino acid adenylation domain protein n=1 Tax=Haliangium ochraceum (strain DSM 14365 / JCM 11303 / SMP-2) TaxID=502025 RepID=D0LQV5_HALO1|nr:non-ribosomal peptide synthetase [Haliangium ochraceum]ACY13665.1 amino acid adenylation domain protein [Haliangium ochraceum DSM 14365]
MPAPDSHPLVNRLAALSDSQRAALAAELLSTPVRPQPEPLARCLGAGRHRASFGQERLWFLDQLAPGQSAYNICASWSLRDAVPEFVDAALQALVRRHTTLRTYFASGPSGLEQVVMDDVVLPLDVVDLRLLEPAARHDALDSLAVVHGDLPFDLEKAPLFRATLVRMGPRTDVLLVALHHIVSDGWSMTALETDFRALLRAELDGSRAALPALETDYAAFSAWQRERVEARADALLRWWRETLAGAPTVLRLPIDRPRPPVTSHQGSWLPVDFGPATSQALRALAVAENTTLFAVCLAAYAALLARVGVTDDVVIGTPLAGRERVEFEGLVGLFVNTLPVRVRCPADASFTALVRQTRDRMLGVLAHQEFPFERLVDALEVPRDLATSPLFQATLAFQNLPTLKPLEPGGARLHGAIRFDLSLHLNEVDGRLVGLLGGRADLFEVVTLQRLRDALLLLCERALAAPEQPLAHISLAPGAAAPEPATSGVSEIPQDPAMPTPDLGRSEALGIRLREHVPQIYDAEGPVTALALDGDAERVAVIGCDARHVATAVAVLARGGSVLVLEPGWPRAWVEQCLDRFGAASVVERGEVTRRSTRPKNSPARLVVAALDRDHQPQLVSIPDAVLTRALAQASERLGAAAGRRIAIGAVPAGVSLVLGTLPALLADATLYGVSTGGDALLDLLAWEDIHAVLASPEDAALLRREGWGDDMRIVVHGSDEAALGLLGGPHLGYAAALVDEGHVRLASAVSLHVAGSAPNPIVPGRAALAGIVGDDWFRARADGTLVHVQSGPRDLHQPAPTRLGDAIASTPGVFDVATAAGDDPLAGLLTLVFAEVLDCDEITPGASFFELGGHSLLVTRAVQLLAQLLEHPISIQAFFDHHTVRGLADHLRPADLEGRAALVLEAAAATQPGARRQPAGERAGLRGIDWLEVLERIPREASPARSPMRLPDERYPLSPGQARFWFLYEFEPQASAYNMALAIPLVDPPAPELVRFAWETLCLRHPALRTVFESTAEGPRQRIEALRPSAWAEDDLREVSAAALQARLEHIAASHTEQPFDLERAPPVRARLVRLRDDRATLLIAMHHIVSDGWSMQILRGELLELLAALRERRPARLPKSTCDHLDHVERTLRADAGALRASLDWWREELAGLPAHLELPTDRPRRHGGKREGASLAMLIPSERVEALSELGGRARATQFMVLVGLVSVLLHRWSGARDFAIGTPRAQREPGEEGLVGFCVNTLAIRVRLDPERSFLEHLAAIRGVVLGAFTHENVPFEKIVDELQLDRDLEHNPIFDTMCALQSIPGRARPSVGELSDKPRQCVSRFELSFYFAEVSEGLLGSLEYRADLFDHARAKRYRAQFQQLLDQVLAQPKRPIAALEICPEPERALRLRASRGPERVPPESCWPRIAARLREQPERVAIIDGDRALTRGELAARCAALAARLRAAGAGPGDPIAVALPRGADAIIGLLACFALRAPYVPIDLQNPVERRRFMVADSGARVVVVAEQDPAWLDPNHTRVTVPDDAEAAPEPAPEAPGACDAPAYIVYTSGSTGQPKGVMVGHRTVDNLVAWQLADFRARPDARTLQFAPLGFDVAIQETLCVLAAGGVLVSTPQAIRADASALLEHIERHRVERLFLPPLVLRELARARRYLDAGPRLAEIICAGEALHIPEGIELLLAPGAVVANQYGPSETHVVTAHVLTGDPRTWPRKPTIGRPIAGVEVRVVAPSGRPVPLGTPGELWVFGPAVGLGYVGRDAETRARFRALTTVTGDTDDTESALGVGFATGDRVIQQPDGALVFLGRADGQLKVRGYRVEPGEIEVALRSLPGVEDAAVGLAKTPRGAEVLTAWLIAERSEDIRDQLRDQLPEAMIPQHLVTVSELPRTSSGKIDRLRLPAEVEEDAPSTEPAQLRPVEHVVRDIWQELLGSRAPSIHDNFFSLGGNSLLAMQLATRVRERLAVELPVRELFERPTIAGLAARIEALGPSMSSAQPQLELVGAQPASSTQARLWFLAKLGPAAGVYVMSERVVLPASTSRSALARALDRLVERHPALRTTLTEIDGAVAQIVHDQATLHLREVEVGALPQAHRPALVARLVAAEREAPFDLEQGPLVRALAIRSPGERLELVLVLHHAICDGWSLTILREELDALLGGHELPPPGRPFAAWAREERAPEASLRFWESELEGAPTVLELPTDRPRPAHMTHAGALRAFCLDPAQTRRLRALGRELDATDFAVFASLIMAFLARISGADDLLLGVPIANRGAPGFERSVGFFANTIVLRAQLDAKPSMRALIRRTAERLVAAQSHQATPFDRVVQRLVPHRDPSRQPLFQVMCSLDNLPGERTAFDPAHVRPDHVQPTRAKFDLSFAIELGEATLIGVEYNTELFDHDTIGAWIEALAALARAVIEDPDVTVDAASLGHAGSAIDSGRPPPPPLRSTLERLEALARREPQRVAVAAAAAAADDDDGERGALTYGALLARASDLAARIARVTSCGPSTRVGVWLERGADMVVAWLGVWSAGATLVPLDPDLPEPRLRAIHADAELACVIGPDRPAPDWATTYVPTGHGASPAPSPRARPADDAYIIYTSGSTGTPKGVRIPWAALDRYLDETRALYSLTPDDRVLQFASPSFDVAVEEILGALSAGSRLVPRPAGSVPTPEQLLDLCRRRGVTLLSLPTSYFQVLAAVLERHPLPDTIRAVIIGGQQVDTDSVTAWSRTGRPIWNMYGPTEATISATAARLADPATRRPAIGRALPSARTYVLDARGAPVPACIPGELFIGGACLARGYLGSEAATDEVFVADPFSRVPGARMYRTGDKVWRRPNGELVFLGRLDDQVKVRGFRIELAEVERGLRRIDLVEDALVAANERGQLVAAVTLKPDSELDVTAIARALGQSLPAYMVPSRIEVRSRLPRTVTGKPDRRALLDDTRAPAAASACLSETEARVAAIWEDLLGVAVDRADDFFARGGHSLLALRLRARLLSELGVELPIATLFAQPTLAAVAEFVEAQLAALSQAPAERVTISRVAATSGPLSAAQRRLLFLERMQPSGAYNLPTREVFREPILIPAVARAVAQVVARHEILRTTYRDRGDEPVQEIGEVPADLLRVVDLRDADPATRDHVAQRLLEGDAARPFDLARGPVVRALLLSLDDRVHVLQFTVHHIAADGWSLPILRQDLRDAYLEALRGHASALPADPEPRLRYLDYARWEQRARDTEREARMLARWRERLADAPDDIALPADRGRSAVADPAGKWIAFALDETVLAGVDRLAREQGTTRFAVLAAAWAAFLWRLSGQRDLVFGVPHANRPHAQLEGMVGFFVNTLPMRVQTPKGASFRALVGAVAAVAVELLELESLPFERLVEALAPARSMARAPLFEVVFGLQDGPTSGRATPDRDGPEEPALVARPCQVKYELSLTFEEASPGLMGFLEYRSARWDDATMRLWIERLRVFVRALVAAPDAAIDSLAWQPPRERALVAGVAAAPVPPLDPVAAFARHADRRPDHPALIAGERCWSYAELAARVGGVARQLDDHGIEPGDRVSLCFQDRAALVVAELACLARGAVFVPLDPGHPRSRRERILDLVEPLMRLGDGDADEYKDLGEARSSLRPRELPATAPAYIIFTSGSSGTPKGVVVSRGSLANHVAAHKEVLQLRPDARCSQVASPAFDASLAEIMPALATGATLMIAPAALVADIARLRAWYEDQRINVAFLPTPLGELMLAALDEQPSQSLQCLYLGGARVTRWAPTGRGDLRILNLYGPTETTVAATWFEFPRDPAAGLPPIGGPVPGTRVHVLDDALQPVAIGEPGELHIAGPQVALGYFGAPALTAERFIPDPWGPEGAQLYRTGDRVRWRADGDLDYLGRNDRQVQIRGVRVEPAEVEAALMRLDQVKQAIVGVDEHAGDRVLVAWIATDAPAGSAARRAALAELLPAAMLPARVIELDSLPLTTSGKIDVAALPYPQRQSAAPDAAGAGERDAVTGRLAQMWSALLDVASVRDADDFFELGGHSLLATRLVARIRREFDIEVSLRQVFMTPTLGEMAIACLAALLERLPEAERGRCLEDA